MPMLNTILACLFIFLVRPTVPNSSVNNVAATEYNLPTYIGRQTAKLYASRVLQ